MFACDREKRGANALKEEIDNKSSQNTANSRSCSTIYQDILNVSEDLDMNGKQVKV
jgi:hypothetical protein